MSEMVEVSDHTIDRIRFWLMRLAMAVAGAGALLDGQATTALGLLIGITIHHWAGAFHPDNVYIRVGEPLT